MSVGKLQQIGISIALGSCLALGCGKEEKAEKPAAEKSEQPAAGAAAPAPVVNPGVLPNFDTLPTVELPGNFPADVPRYPGARAVKATPDTANEGSWVAQFSTPDEPAKIYANLEPAFAAQGWTTERGDASDGLLLYAHKGERSATYALGTDKGKTIVSLIIVAKP
jgi:hypothetical protein